AANNSYTVTEDSPNNVLDVLGNDSDVDGDMLTIGAVGALSAGGTAVNNSTTISYTPALNFFGTETFTYTVADGNGGEDTAVVTITVTSVNDAPLANSDSYTSSEDLPLVVNAPGVLLNDMDVEGDALTAVLDTDVTSGTLSLSSNGSFVYTPTLNFCGTDSFSYHADDGQAASNVVTVTMNLTCLNDAPTAADDMYSVMEDSSNNVLNVLANDTDVDGDEVSLTAVTSPSNGTAILSGTVVLYTPNPNFAGMDVFTYTVSDGALTDTAVVTISIDNVNDAPTAVADSYTINEDNGSQVLAVLLNDYDMDVGDSLSIVAVSMPDNGTAVISGTIILYTPALNFFGTDVFSYTISDGQLTDTAVVTVMVNAVNDAPTAVADSYTVDQNSSDNMFAVLDNDSDIEGDSLSLVSVSGASNGTAIISGTLILYTPNFDFVGTETLTYTISDGELTASASLTVTVLQIDTGFLIYLPFLSKP
ncbi:MAG: tandem-95 repeat protein, partial [Anaerolineales bacterium]|nr:tandem-95 repeat protein [Anaerolineales bacterium]